MKRIFILFALIFALLLVGCDNQSKDTDTDKAPKQTDNAPTKNEEKKDEVIPTVDPDDINEDMALSFIKGEVVFEDFSTKTQTNLYTLGYAGAHGTPYQYTLVDLDNDGARELVVEYDTTGDRAVIDINGNVCSSYYVPLRGMNLLKVDGTMSWSNSAFEHGVKRIKFSAVDI